MIHFIFLISSQNDYSWTPLVVRAEQRRLKSPHQRLRGQIPDVKERREHGRVSLACLTLQSNCSCAVIKYSYTGENARKKFRLAKSELAVVGTSIRPPW